MKTSDFNIESFITAGEQFFTELTANLNTLNISTEQLKCDHLCFRVATQNEYDFFRSNLSQYGKLLTEAQVNGRAIATFKLTTPFKTKTHEISLLELPAPKSGAEYQTGFEHAEFVINESFADFKEKHAHVTMNEGGNKTFNPELTLKLNSNQQVKFHHHTLERVIEIEEAKIKDIIFDFDGTLIESREIIYELNRQVLSKALGREVSLKESIDKFHADFPKLFAAFNIENPETQKQAVTDWGLLSDNFTYKLFLGAKELLVQLKNQGYRLHLWTARDEYSARKILKHHELEDFFETLSFSNDTSSKPHAENLKYNWKLAQKDQVILIGDSPTDMLGARNINAIKGAALWDPYAKKSALIETGAELFFHEVSDILKL